MDKIKMALFLLCITALGGVIGVTLRLDDHHKRISKLEAIGHVHGYSSHIVNSNFWPFIPLCKHSYAGSYSDKCEFCGGIVK